MARLATVALVHNPKAIVALVFAVLAVLFLAAGVAVPQVRDEIGPLEALVVVPAALIAALIGIAMSRRARFDFQRTLGRIGGNGVAQTARLLSVLALLLAITAGLAAAVYGVLVLVEA